MKKSGHTDVASSRRMCLALVEDATDINNSLPTDEEASLPTWWTNKLAISAAYVNSLRDYLIYSSEEQETSENLTNNPQTVESYPITATNNQQVTVGDYTTKHFDICPSAQALYSTISDKTDMIHLIVETMMLHDLLFRLEKQAIAMGSIDQEELEKAEEFAELIMDNAKQMRLEAAHSYINDIHIAKFKQLAGVSMVEVEDDMLPPSARMMRYAATKR